MLDNTFLHHYLQGLSGNSTQAIAEELYLFDRNAVQRWSSGNKGRAWWPRLADWRGNAEHLGNQQLPDGFDLSQRLHEVVRAYVRQFRSDSEEEAYHCLLDACRDWLIDPAECTRLEEIKDLDQALEYVIQRAIQAADRHEPTQRSYRERFTFPKDLSEEDIRAAAAYYDQRAEFQRLVQAQDWEGAYTAGEDFWRFLRGNADRLSLSLPDVGYAPDRKNHRALSPALCAIPKDGLPLFCARHRLEQGELLLRWSREKDSNTAQQLRRLEALEVLAEAETLAQQAAGMENILLESTCKGTPPLSPVLQAQAQLDRAELFLDLDCPDWPAEDRNRCALDPAEAAIKAAEPLLSGGHTPALEERRTRIQEILNTRRAPAVSCPAEVPPAEATPIYSPAFDSAAAAERDNQEDLELLLFQLSASSRTVLFTLPQVMDNRYLLSLLHHSGFRSLCQSGVAALSAFTPQGQDPILDPAEYLLQSLQNEKFCFSASPWLAQEAVRQAVGWGIAEHRPFRSVAPELPDASRAELEELYGAYRLASEVFRPSLIRTFHQDTTVSRRTAPPAVTLPQEIQSRINALWEDEEHLSLPGRAALLTQAQALQKAAEAEGLRFRSDYRAALDRWRNEAAYAERELDFFRALVDGCYSANLGRRACPALYDQPVDPLLCLHAVDGPAERRGDSSGAVRYAFRLYRDRRSGTRTLLDWQNITEVALTARRLELERQSPAQKETRLGLGFLDTEGGALCSDFQGKTTSGHTTRLTQDAGTQEMQSELYLAGKNESIRR
ncbi:hypothetical protein B5G43_12180 [Flavonifractor sp. An92]|uniref:hypothetical protein n=1 Tax=Flavonifractor sp. An92 TaxID=1965666 RepID=UPI000B38CFAD|nr:hypothetical protein [Flavonifractor sp. An92]OUN05662.1 hypothetical protein B5G43_12180 [Flavonifractor sp. An92]